MSIGALNAALSGLRVSQQQLNVISNNVANVGNEGYTRKVLPQTTQTINGKAASARTENIIRNVDQTLSRDVWTQVSTASSTGTRVDYLQKIEQFHGAPDAEVSFSAEISELRDSFSALSDSPEDSFLQSSTVNQAVDTAGKIKEFAGHLTQLRNDAQNDIESGVERINGYLSQLAELNSQIKFQISTDRTTAQLEDFRDQVVNKLSEEINISFFTRGDGVMIVQTKQGEELAGETAKEFKFDPSPLGPEKFYQPDGNVAGLFLNGDPENTVGGVDLTQQDLGGKVGQLLELRDKTLPAYTAQIDEVAHKMAQRFEAQGLRLYTDGSGRVPGDEAPTPGNNPPTPVSYVGFASEMQVNEMIMKDNSLIQSGTAPTDEPVPKGSSEVISRVLDFTFSNISHQQTGGETVVDLRDATAGVGVDMQQRLGIYSQNTINGTTRLSDYGSINNAAASPDLVSTAGDAITGANDRFRLSIDGVNMDIDLSDAATNHPVGGGITNAGDQIVAEINDAIGAAVTAGTLPANHATARLGTSGQLVIETRGDVNIDASIPNGMGQKGLSFIGLEEGNFEAEAPYFDVQVGKNASERVYIEPGDTETDLIDKLIYDGGADSRGVPGLTYDKDTFDNTGQLILRPGQEFDRPGFGGELKISGGNFTTGLPSDTLYTAPGNTELNNVAANSQKINIASAIFGSFANNAAPGTNYVEDSPIQNVEYGSTVSGTDSSTTPFRNQHLGPNADIELGVVGSENLIDFSQKIINRQSEDLGVSQNHYEDEESFRQTLQRQLSDESGVNIDEELSNMIVVQTAYSAAARAVSAIDEQFQELLNSFRS